jgi:ribonuclease VapC
VTGEPRLVLDASAMLAYLFEEPGGDAVAARLRGSAISTVNWAEVLQKSYERGADVAGLRSDLAVLGAQILHFTEEHAEWVAVAWEVTRSLGLSLADRACLSLARELGGTVLTAERSWARLPEDVGLDIEVIR